MGVEEDTTLGVNEEDPSKLGGKGEGLQSSLEGCDPLFGEEIYG